MSPENFDTLLEEVSSDFRNTTRELALDILKTKDEDGLVSLIELALLRGMQEAIKQYL